MTALSTVKLTTHFERNLQEIETFLEEANTFSTFDVLLDELTDRVIPNLRRFPGMGRPFLERPIRSIEVSNSVAGLKQQVEAFDSNCELREYLMAHYALIYAQIGGVVYLLSIRHHRQLSFDLPAHWTR